MTLIKKSESRKPRCNLRHLNTALSPIFLREHITYICMIRIKFATVQSRRGFITFGYITDLYTVRALGARSHSLAYDRNEMVQLGRLYDFEINFSRIPRTMSFRIDMK